MADPVRLTIDNPAFQTMMRAGLKRQIRFLKRVPRSLLRDPGDLRFTSPAIPRQQPTAVLNRDRVNRPTSVKKHRWSKRQLALASAATVMLLLGGYISLTGWKANKVAQVQAANLTAQANGGGGGSSHNSVAPSTVKPSSQAVASYAVGPDMPRYINIAKLGVHARVMSVGVNSDGSLGTPRNIYDTAWYNESSTPGEPGGAMLIDGHVSSWTAHGVFYGIKTLKPGDVIQVVRGDGKIFNYKVVKSQTYASGKVDMASVLMPVNPAKPGLNLITCTGDVIPGTNEFNERVVVFAEQI